MRWWSSRFVLKAIVALLSILPARSPIMGQSAPTQGRAAASAEKSSPSLAPSAPAQGRAAPPSAKPPAAPDLADEVEDDPWEERKARAREDVEFLEAVKRAKQAEVHEAEVRVAGNNAWKIDHERQKKGGILSPFQIRQAEIIMAEGQAQLEMKRVDQKDVEIRLARARRKLKAVERSASSEPEGSPNEDRFRELEIKYDRLRSEFDRIKRYSDYSRDGQDRPLTTSPMSGPPKVR